MSQGKHILLVEGKDEGHHLVYVNALVEAMRTQGHRVTVSLPERGGATREKLLSRGCQWLEEVEWVPWTRGLGARMLDAAALMKRSCGADEVFFGCVDEWASGTLRRAAFGLKPPNSLKGSVSGIYVRPRPLDPECRPRGLNAWLKHRAWRQLDKEGWFQRIFVLDERLPDHPGRVRGKCRVSFMPEPNEAASQPYPRQREARHQLGIPQRAVVFLHYGLGTRRKGLHHVVEAWRQLSENQAAVLLVAGQPEPEFLPDLRLLRDAGRAILLDHYIGSAEEKLVLAASDVVLIPYVNHYGSSNVLSRAAAANRVVLASDHGLVGYRVRKYGLGHLCTHDDPDSLRKAIIQISNRNMDAMQLAYANQLRTFAAAGSPEQLSRLLA